MKIVNAKLYEEQIKRKFWEVWYDEKYSISGAGHGGMTSRSMTGTTSGRAAPLRF